MARADAAAFTRVLVVAPRTRVDVALPAEIPIVELLPTLLDMVGERSDDGGAQHDGWVLTPVNGDALNPARTLRALDILDGTALQLHPRRPPVAEPIFDDVVDAIASSVRGHTDARGLRDLTGALAAGAGLLVLAFVLVAGDHSVAAAAVAGFASVLALITSAAIARSGGSRVVAVTIGACGAAPAYAAGMLAIRGSFGYPAALLAATATLVYAVLAAMLVRTGTVVLSTLSTVASFALVATAFGFALQARPAHVAIVAAAAALGAITLLPWLAVRLARLPMPIIPTNPDQLRDASLGVDFAAVGARAAVAAEYLDGMTIGCAVIAAAGAAVALSAGSSFAVLFGAVMVAALLLRVRSVSSRLARLGLVLTGLASAVVGLAGAALAAPDQTVPLAGTVLVLTGIAVLVSVFVPRRPLSPMTGRSIDIAENIVLVSVLPLALGAIDLYSTVRHW